MPYFISYVENNCYETNLRFHSASCVVDSVIEFYIENNFVNNKNNVVILCVVKISLREMRAFQKANKDYQERNKPHVI